MMIYDGLGNNVKKKRYKELKEDLVSIITKCGGLPVTFSKDNTVGVYEVPEEGMVIFNDHKNFIRVWIGFDKCSKLSGYLLDELGKLKEEYQ